MTHEPVKRWVLLVSLGPVQDFIASARRCQDLWFGSWMLSDLSRACAKAIEDAEGADALIFPGSVREAEQDDESPAVANKILAIVRNPKESAQKAEDAMHDRLELLRDEAFERLPTGRYFDDHMRQRAIAQINDLMEFFYVAVPLDPSGSAEAYAEARDRAERLLAARKNTRTWKQVLPSTEGGWGDFVPKSSMDGQRESVLSESLYSSTTRSQELRQRYFVRKQERLCGIGLLKRLGSEFDEDGKNVKKARFLSTSHVATAPVRTRIAIMGAPARDAVRQFNDTVQAMLPRKWKSMRWTKNRTANTPYVRDPRANNEHGIGTPLTFGDCAFDGELLHRGQHRKLVEDYLSDEFEKELSHERRDREAHTKMGRALTELLRALDLSEERVPKYYATILADGDNMGAMLDAVGRKTGLDGHRKISHALDTFSRGCREIVESHAGSLIYAGGDDVLALAPLHTVLSCVRMLHDRFEETLRSVLEELPVDVQAPTLSIGVGIGHHLEDMADTRELAKRAERLAKATPNKDALAILWQMRGGATLEVTGPFGEKPALDQRLHDWALLIQDEAISAKAAHDLESELAVLLQGTYDARLDTVARNLALRVLERKRSARGEAPLSSNVRALTDRVFEGTHIAEAVRRLSHELQMAKMIAAAYDVAFPRTLNSAKEGAA